MTPGSSARAEAPSTDTPTLASQCPTDGPTHRNTGEQARPGRNGLNRAAAHFVPASHRPQAAGPASDNGAQGKRPYKGSRAGKRGAGPSDPPAAPAVSGRAASDAAWRARPQKQRSPSRQHERGPASRPDGRNSKTAAKATAKASGTAARTGAASKARGAVGGGRTFNGGLTNSGDGDGPKVGHGDGDGGAAQPSGESQSLSSTLAKRLEHGTYECMICCDSVRRRHAVWQCDHCWAIFHIGCVGKWAKSCSSEPGARWRCPGCQHERVATPIHYLCFCGAERDPEPPRGIVPHSCGQTCGRSRRSHCPHPCMQPCHPGPCAPCTELAPEQSCFCGRHIYQPRCGTAYDPVNGVKSCGAECGEMLSCGLHKCEQPCHGGLCQPCPREEQQLCYCGRHTRTARCGDGRPKSTLTAAGRVTGYYSCGTVCDQPLTCGVHTCERLCHAHAGPSLTHGDCSLDPATASTCHCSKRPASALGHPRTLCTDPVPSCGDACGRVGSGCAHPCQAPCHAGPCPPCRIQVDTPCGCGATRAQVECHASRTTDGRPRCERQCTKKRACRRHQCAVRCCPSDHTDIDGAVIPSERLAAGETDPHQCALVCGRQLRCKAHRCAELCHRGPCPPCRTVGEDVLSCACGRTQLFPPIPCGTTLPPCHHPCPRQRECGHISLTPHECHPDSAPCPPCPVLVATDCMCGAKEMKNVPCHRTNIASCGSICNRTLPCGGHQCPRSCHRRDEPCLRGQVCRQPCGKPRKACGHPCTRACHSPAMCDESAPCEALVDQACACGRMVSHVMCGATAGRARPGASAKLACNDLCKIAERNRRLAIALDLQDRAEAPLAGLIKATYSEDLLRFARANLALVRDTEARASEFVADRTRGTLHFAPMKHTSRAFLHALAPFYGCKSRSMDCEPRRSACWDRSAHATIPSILLSNAVRYAQPPPMVCSNRVAETDESDLDETGSHVFDGASWATNTAADRLRKKLDHIVIRNLRHALTADELRAELDRLLPGAPYVITWAGEDEVEMRCTDAAARNECLVKWEAMLKAKLPRLGIAGLVKGVPSTPSATPTPAPIRAPSPVATRGPDADETESAASSGSALDDWELLFEKDA